jgi:iron complex outermembrane recepter protein
MTGYDSHNIHPNLDPLSVQDSYTLFGARIALEAYKWSFAIIGENLTDEEVSTYSINVPLSGTSFGTNTRDAFIKPPRTITFEVSYDF